MRIASRRWLFARRYIWGHWESGWLSLQETLQEIGDSLHLRELISTLVLLTGMKYLELGVVKFPVTTKTYKWEVFDVCSVSSWSTSHVDQVWASRVIILLPSLRVSWFKWPNLEFSHTKSPRVLSKICIVVINTFIFEVQKGLTSLSLNHWISWSSTRPGLCLGDIFTQPELNEIDLSHYHAKFYSSPLETGSQ